MRKNVLFRVTAILGITGIAFIVPASAAHADVNCVGTETVTYQPGLLLTTQTVHSHVHGILTPCMSSDPDITSGTYSEDFSTTLSRGTALATRAGTRVVTWNDGSLSTFAFNRAISDVGGQTTMTLTGTITSGRFAGDTAVMHIDFVSPNTLNCLAPPGITQLGPGTGDMLLH